MSSNSASLRVKILRYINNSPRLSRALDKVGNKVIKRLYSGYLSGLSRQMLRLSGQIQDGANVELRSDGIYHNDQKLSENPFNELLPENISLQLNFSSAEDLATLGRMARSSSQYYGTLINGSSQNRAKKSVLSNTYLLNIFPLILEKAKTLKEFKQWDIAIQSIISNLPGSPDTYAATTLPLLLGKSSTFDKIEEWIKTVDSLATFNYRKTLLAKSKTVSELKLWDEAVSKLEDVLKPVFEQENTLSDETSIIASLLKKVTSVAELDGWRAIIKDAVDKLGKEKVRANIMSFYRNSNNPAEFKEKFQEAFALFASPSL